jgi:hypothetical protein
MDEKERSSQKELPFILNVKDIARIMSLSHVTAYNLVNSDSFPKIKCGRKNIIPRDAFIKWLEDSIGKQVII